MSEAHCAPLLISSADRSLHFGTHALFLTLHGVLLDGNVILSPALDLRGCSKIQRNIHYKETSLIKTFVIIFLFIKNLLIWYVSSYFTITAASTFAAFCRKRDSLHFMRCATFCTPGAVSR